MAGSSGPFNLCKYLYIGIMMIVMIVISANVTSMTAETAELIDIRTDFMN